MDNRALIQGLTKNQVSESAANLAAEIIRAKRLPLALIQAHGHCLSKSAPAVAAALSKSTKFSDFVATLQKVEKIKSKLANWQALSAILIAAELAGVAAAQGGAPTFEAALSAAIERKKAAQTEKAAKEEAAKEKADSTEAASAEVTPPPSITVNTILAWAQKAPTQELETVYHALGVLIQPA